MTPEGRARAARLARRAFLNERSECSIGAATAISIAETMAPGAYPWRECAFSAPRPKGVGGANGAAVRCLWSVSGKAGRPNCASPLAAIICQLRSGLQVCGVAAAQTGEYSKRDRQPGAGRGHLALAACAIRPPFRQSDPSLPSSASERRASGEIVRVHCCWLA